MQFSSSVISTTLVSFYTSGKPLRRISYTVLSYLLQTTLRLPSRIYGCGLVSWIRGMKGYRAIGTEEVTEAVKVMAAKAHHLVDIGRRFPEHSMYDRIDLVCFLALLRFRCTNTSIVALGLHLPALWCPQTRPVMTQFSQSSSASPSGLFSTNALPTHLSWRCVLETSVSGLSSAMQQGQDRPCH